MARKLKICVTDECVGDGLCVEEAPKTFEMNDDNLAVVKEGKIDDEETILNAAEACPTDAIVVTDEATGEQIFPEP